MVGLYYGYVLAGVGGFFLLFCLANILWMRRHSRGILSCDGPRVSVLVPARNEEDNIRNCLDSLLNQTYRNYEILVLNDNSEDNTLAILREYEQKFPGKVRCFDGKPLPHDWQGKCYAMHQLTARAEGEFLLFTDADTVHTPDSVSYAAANLIRNNADMISGYIHQDLLTLGERLTVPLMFMLTGFILLLPLDKVLRNPMFAAAIGQYIAVRASSFRAIGGYEAVKKMTTEDMYLARLLKRAGYKTLFIMTESVARCRMYHSYRDAVCGIGKNIFDFFEKRTAVLFVILAAIVIFMLFPPFILFYRVVAALFFAQPLDTFALCLAVHVALIFLAWFTLFWFQKLPLGPAFYYPVLFVNLTIMAMYSWYGSMFGVGYLWKGRLIK
ncbi:MAG: glycosyltransferase family 2 protein [Spirochaetaceae bacterium]|jgi:chlorobactene glucosyltransferase|nr:glycosyltransferase family 2 protein [Spirochaetaceae bacterium]